MDLPSRLLAGHGQGLTRLALVVSAADPTGSPWLLTAAAARATLLDPGRPSRASPTTARSVLGSGLPKPSPSAADHFEAELLKQEANPACGPRFCPVYASRKSFGAVIPGNSGSGPGCRQHSGLGGWLDLSI